MKYNICDSSFVIYKSYRSVLFFALINGFLIIPGNSLAAQTTRPICNGFTEEQKDEIGQIAATYLAQHPEYLIAAQEELRQHQLLAQQVKIKESAPSAIEDLLHDNDTPYLGPKDAKVAIIIFSDYLDPNSKKLNIILDGIIQDNPQVKVLYKDFPMMSGKFPASGWAAVIAHSQWRIGGVKDYFSLRTAFYGINNQGNSVSLDDLKIASKSAGLATVKNYDNYTPDKEYINKNLKLGQDLGMSTTPNLIVMPQNGASSKNISVFISVPTQQQITYAINLANNDE